MTHSRRNIIEYAVFTSIITFLVLDLAFGPFFYVVVSGSMEPTLQVNDVVAVQHVPFSSVKVGDIVVFNVPNSYGGCTADTVVHRVVGFSANGGLITKGDANALPDEPTAWLYVNQNCFIGAVAFTIPQIGYVARAFPYPVMLLAIAVVIAVVLFSDHFSRDS